MNQKINGCGFHHVAIRVSNCDNMNHLTKNLSIGGCVLALTIMGWAAAQEGTPPNADAATYELLEMTLTAPPYAVYSKKNVPLRVTFANHNDKNIRLLHLFKPVKTFFQISLTTSTGKIVKVPVVTDEGKVGSAAPRPNPLQYIDLGLEETFGTLVDVSELLPSNLPEGFYRVTLTYRNRQGENCFKGTKTADRVFISIVDEPVEDVPGSISKQKAIDLARQAIKGKITPKKDAKISVRNTATQFIVTFGGPPPAGTLGPDYSAQVSINRLTGVVESVLSGS